ncbi:ERF family protein [Palleronia sp. KMU-117]|uniref:ERF family protein n=1 Tax=Palleronia sp. KMU-117 TaxID=3434108 RepID=UPI003D75D9DA
MADLEIKNLTAAVIKVMEEVKGVEKNTTVSAGNSSYKGVSDKDVKDVIRRAMIKNGLAILPVDIKEETEVTRWEEKTSYGLKQKQNVFTRAHVTYRLLHTSGEYMDVQGIGHGVDTQDKSAGKATTYALKYALLYTFLVPTGDIDDADAVHSDAHQVAPTKAAPKKAAAPVQPQVTLEQAFAKLRAADSIPALEAAYKALPAALRKDTEVIAVATEVKQGLLEPVIE